MKIDAGGAVSVPGQFVNLRVNESFDPLLRRPFSVFNQEGRVIELVIQVVGKGTRWLAEHAVPGEVDILGPLGKGFTLCEGKTALLVGGGVGNAPLYYLARRLREKGNHVIYLYGSRASDCVFLRERYEQAADTFLLSTDDGSAGRRGYVTDLAREILSDGRVDRIYTCGPTVMMKSLSEMPGCAGIPLEVSVENYFGCGIGICAGCVVETPEGNRRACVDGPVFDGRMVRWESLAE